MERDDFQAKFWLDPIRLERSTGFARAELTWIEKLVVQHADELRRAWNDFFGT